MLLRTAQRPEYGILLPFSEWAHFPAVEAMAVCAEGLSTEMWQSAPKSLQETESSLNSVRGIIM